MSEQITTHDIVNYWNKRVGESADPGAATLLDHNMRRLEIDTVASWLDPTDRVLDVFCGNAVTTIELAPFCTSVTGVDLSERMLEAGNSLIRSRRIPADKIVLKKGNVVELASVVSPAEFNTVVSIRGLINLPSWELQKQVLLAFHELLPQGGKLLLLEGSRDGLERINELRTRLSLKPLHEPWYDKHLAEPLLLKFLAPYFAVEDRRNLDTYFLMSRVLYPLAAAPEEPRFDHLCNTLARLSVPFAKTDAGTSLLICMKLRKK
jgi:SAM-dependent methyltransferase